MKKTYSQWRQDLIFNKKFLWNHFQFRKTYCFTNVSRWRFKFKFEKPSSKTRREKPAMLCRSYSSIRWQKTVWIWDRWQDWWHFSTIASSLKNCDIQKKSYEQGHLSSRNLEAVQSSTKFSLSGKKLSLLDTST